MIGGVALVLDRHQGNVLLLQAVAVHVAVHLDSENPKQVRSQRALGDVVEDGQEGRLRVGEARGHLLLANHQGGVEEPTGHVVPALDGGKDPGATAHVGAHIGLAPGSSPIAQVFAFHVDAVKGVGGRAHAHGVYVLQGQLARIEGHLGRFVAQFLARLLGAAHEFRHPRPDDGNSSHSHAVIPPVT